MERNYQVTGGPHKVGSEWRNGFQITTKSGRYVGTVQNLSDVDAAIAKFEAA